MFRQLGGLAAVLILATVTGARPAGEAEAVAAIEKAGGQAKRDDTAPGKPVVEVSLLGEEVRDANLVPLKSLPKVQKLELRNTSVTDNGLEYVRPLANLRWLS